MTRLVADVNRAFPGGIGLVVQLYLRREDNRARIVCKWRGRTGGSRYSCLPLNTLEFHREGPSLLLCRHLLGSSEVEEWATLKFSTMERELSPYTLSNYPLTRSQDSLYFTVHSLPFVPRI